MSIDGDAYDYHLPFFQYLIMEQAWGINVGVQIFFAISGYLYGGKDIGDSFDYLRIQFCKILIPYWLFLTVLLVVQRIAVPEVFSWGKSISAFLCIGVVEGAEHLWFVEYILICYLLVPYLNLLKKELCEQSVKKSVVGFIALFVLLQWLGIGLQGLYQFKPNRINCFLAGYLLAVIVRKSDEPEKTENRCLWIVGIPAVLFNAYRIWQNYVQKAEGGVFYRIFECYAHALLGIFLFLLMMRLFRNLQYNTLLRFTDRFSYSIYIVHQIFILGPLSLMKLTGIIALNIGIICVLIVVSGIVLKWISDKGMVLAQKTGIIVNKC